MAAHRIFSRSAPSPELTVRYGPGPDHVADVWLPPGRGVPGTVGGAPFVLLLHGGFWRDAYDRAHAAPMASALAAEGYAVCTPEYRRTGQPGGGWPGTFDDVAAAVSRLPALVAGAAGSGVLAAGQTVLAGHSAGGHLALWAAGRHLLPDGARWRQPAPPPVRGVVALAAVTDLAASYARGLGRGAAGDLLGGGPDEHPDRYAAADPARLLPLACPVRLVHGTADDRVPVDLSRDYLAKARAVGGGDREAAAVHLDELPGADHFDLIDPRSAAWPKVVAAFLALAEPEGLTGG